MINFFSRALPLRLVLVLCPFFLAKNTYATVIDFDDLVRDPGDGCFCAQPISNEYAAKGLLIDSAFLVDADVQQGWGVSAPNALLGGDSFRLNFTGLLPKFVSFTVSAAFGQASFIDVSGSKGHAFTARTGGDAGEGNITPYVPNKQINLHLADGISSIGFSTFYGLRTTCLIDNLRYEYKEVPESSSLGLLVIGGLLLLVRRRNA